jgi:hypothetical protein
VAAPIPLAPPVTTAMSPWKSVISESSHTYARMLRVFIAVIISL